MQAILTQQMSRKGWMIHELQKRKTVYHPADRLTAVEQEAVLGGSISLETIPCPWKNSGDKDMIWKRKLFHLKKNTVVY